MPIARIGDKVIHYVHVPKCAGQAVETYMEERFGAMGFLDNAYGSPNRRPPHWSRTSPQHADAATMQKLFPPGFFDARFAVVRHPASRIKSSYDYERKMGRIRPGQSFAGWLGSLPAERHRDRFARDNHVRPMTEMVPEDTDVFRLEDGFDALVKWFDDLAGDQAPPRKIPKGHSTDDLPRIGGRLQRSLGRWLDKGPGVLDPALCKTIHSLYCEDYERFGYGIFDPLEHKA